MGYAQTQPKPRKAPVVKKKPVAVKATPAKADTAVLVTLPSTLLLDDSMQVFDPMDSVTLKKSKSALDVDVKYHAEDSMPYYAASQTVYLYRKAQVNFGDLELKADFIMIELGKSLVTAHGSTDSLGNVTGKPVFKQGGTEYKAEVIKYNYKTKKGYLSEFRTKEGEGYIHGQDVGKDADNSFGVQHAKYTTCELEHPHYYIGASRIKVIPDKKVVMGPANLVIEDVHTPLVLPFGIFSIRKGQSSGVVVPQYGSSFGRGYFLRDGGYYFGLGEHADLRLTGDIYTNLSWAVRGGLRYGTRYRFNGDLTVNIADNKTGNPEDPTYTRSKDFLFTWLHRSDPKARPNTTFNANVNITSVNPQGNSYLNNNSYNANNIVTNQLLSSVAFSKSFKNGRYNFTSGASMSQNTLSRDVSISLPDISFTVSSFAPFKPRNKPVADRWFENITTNYTLLFKNTVNTKDSILFRGFKGNEFANFYDTAGKYGVQHSLPIQTSFKVLKYYTFSVSTSLNEVWYMQTIRKSYDTATRTLTTTRVNGFERALTFAPHIGLATRYYGMAQFRKGKITAIRHVVTPSVGFTYAPDFSGNGWGYYRSYTDETGKVNKYSIFEQGIFGGPSAGRQGNVDFAIDNNIEMKVKTGKDTAMKETKVQIFESIRVSGFYNLLADSLKLSPLTFSARTKLFKNIQVNGGATLDPYRNRVVTSEAGFKTVTRDNVYSLNDNRTPGTITDANLGISGSFSRETFMPKKTNRTPFEGELKYINDNPGEYYDFNVPWTVNVNYTVTYRKYNNLNDTLLSNFIQTFNFSGDINLTKNWKIGYSSGYDLQQKQLTFTSIDFVRQLHCWEFKLNWIPVGYRQSFLFTINVKSSLLQDLRMTRRRDWFDRRI